MNDNSIEKEKLVKTSMMKNEIETVKNGLAAPSEIAVQYSFYEALDELERKNILTSCIADKRISNTRNSCVQYSPGVVAWKMETSRELECFDFGYYTYDSSGTVVRFPENSLNASSSMARLFLFVFCFSTLLALLAMGSMLFGENPMILLYVALGGIVSCFPLAAKGIWDDMHWVKKKPRQNIKGGEKLYFFPMGDTIPELLRISEPVADLVRNKIVTAESKWELDKWATMLTNVLAIQKDFPIDLIPMENDHMKTLFDKLNARAAEIRAEWEEQSAIESVHNKARESKVSDSRREDSEVTLEGALSIVDGLTIGDFEKEWKV